MPTLNADEKRALARMARGGVFVDGSWRGVFGGRVVIASSTVQALASARLICVEGPAGVPRLTGEGRRALAGSPG